MPDPDLPTVPAHLSDEAKVEWGRIANEMYELGVLTKLDRAVLAAYCQAWADWVEAEREIARTGKLIRSPTRTITRRARDGSETTEQTGGYPMQSPWVAIRNRAAELMYKFACEFGMGPSSRSRVNADGKRPPGKNKAKKYFD